ncbi:MAG: hypothetical protein ABJP66_07105 [Hyphomicrobiales bacterium]
MARRRRAGWRIAAKLPQVVIATVLLLLFVYFGISSFAEWPANVTVPSAGSSSVVLGEAYVIDGDTLRIKGTKVRLSGVAAPESHEPGGGGGYALYAAKPQWARTALRAQRADEL